MTLQSLHKLGSGKGRVLETSCTDVLDGCYFSWKLDNAGPLVSKRTDILLQDLVNR